MDVELVILQRAVLDGPVFDRSLRGDDRGWIVGAEQGGWLTIHRDVKVSRATGIVRVLQHFGKV